MAADSTPDTTPNALNDCTRCAACGVKFDHTRAATTPVRVTGPDGSVWQCQACWYGWAPTRQENKQPHRTFPAVTTDRDQTAAGLQLANAIAAAVYGPVGEYR